MTKSTGVGRGAGGGPKTKYRAVFVEQAKQLCKLGATERELAQFFGVDEETFRRWKHEHPKLCGAVTVGKGPSNQRVEQSLYRRATGYSYDGEELFVVDHVEETPNADPKLPSTIVRTKKVLRVPVIKHVAPSDTSMIFWLKNRRKDRWRDFKATELSTAPGHPLEVKSTAPGEPELIGAYFRRLAAAAAAGSTVGTDPDPDPGVGEGGQKPDGSPGGKKAGQG